MEVICSIKGVKEDMDGTQMLIQAKNANVANYIIEHCISMGRLVIMDGRFISPEQRKKAYATERDIAEYCGYMSKDEKAYVHEALKAECEKAYRKEAFSLSDCTMDTARDYIAFLLEYAIQNGIPLTDNLTNRAEEIDRALIACIKHRKCCVRERFIMWMLSAWVMTEESMMIPAAGSCACVGRITRNITRSAGKILKRSIKFME